MKVSNQRQKVWLTPKDEWITWLLTSFYSCKWLQEGHRNVLEYKSWHLDRKLIHAYVFQAICCWLLSMCYFDFAESWAKSKSLRYQGKEPKCKAEKYYLTILFIGHVNRKFRRPIERQKRVLFIQDCKPEWHSLWHKLKVRTTTGKLGQSV